MILFPHEELKVFRLFDGIFKDGRVLLGLLRLVRLFVMLQDTAVSAMATSPTSSVGVRVVLMWPSTVWSVVAGAVVVVLQLSFGCLASSAASTFKGTTG